MYSGQISSASGTLPQRSLPTTLVTWMMGPQSLHISGIDIPSQGQQFPTFAVNTVDGALLPPTEVADGLPECF